MLAAFDAHRALLRELKRKRQDDLAIRSTFESSQEQQTAATADEGPLAGIGQALPTDEFDGDACHRSLMRLLAIVDDRGFQRSAHQLRFHAEFVTAVLRVLYKREWSTEAPNILKKHGLEKSHSEVLISTPRRFGKTFR